MDCGAVFAKYVLFIFNILFVVCGILLIVFGSIMVSHITDIGSISEVWQANSVPIAVLVLGCIIFIIAFLGCCGAIREDSCLTTTYSICMLVLFIAQLALIIYIWAERQKFLNAMDTVVTKVWDQHKTDQKVMDAFQLSFNCCGKDNVIDYTSGGEKVPISCCGAKATSCSILEAMGRPGCSRAFNKFWSTNTDIIRFAGLGVAGVELIAFIFACCLANQVRNDRRRGNY